MLKIKYYGHSCFVCSGEFSVCLDPYGDIGCTLPEITTDYYFCSHNHYDHNAKQSTMGISAKDVSFFEKIKTFHDNEHGRLRGENTVLKFKLNGVTFAHLGDLGEEDNKELIGQLKGVDVLFVPIGGRYTINAKQAVYYTESILPKIVIPMHYKFEKSTIDIDNEDEFLNLIKNKYKIIKLKDSESEINLSDTENKVLFFKAEV